MRRLLWWIGPLLLAAFALTWCFLCGERGFFAFRQSAVFDGAYRILSGQVPFRDFAMPNGPVPLWLQASFFWVFGANSFAYLLGAAVVNAGATLLTVGIMRLLFPGERDISYLAGLSTAIWFYPPAATPWIDQTGFALLLVAIFSTLYAGSGRSGRPGCALAFAAAGAAMVLSFLSRQSAAVFGLPIVVLLTLLRGRVPAWNARFRLLWFGVGCAVAIGVFVTWLFVCSEPDVFARHFFEIPSKSAVWNFLSNWYSFVKSFVFGIGSVSVRAALVISGGCAFLVTGLLLLGTLTGARPAPAAWPPCVLSVGLLAYQYAFRALSDAPDAFCLPFVGLVIILGARCVELALIISRPKKALLRLLAMLLLAITMLSGMRTSWTRRVYGTFDQSTFGQRMSIDGFGAIRWAKPTTFGYFDYTEEAIEALVDQLKRYDKPFFVFPDFTFLYALVGRPSPQPLLWFEPGVTYPVDYSEAVDDWILRELQQNDVQVVLMEFGSVLGLATERIDHFPKVAAWFARNFDLKEQLGSFSIWIKKRP